MASPAVVSAATRPARSIGIIIYTMYGHIAKLAEAEKAGIEAAGGKAVIYQVPETLNEEVLGLLKAPPKPDYPVCGPEDMKNHDGFLFGIATRYGGFPAQLKAFWDSTGYLWAQALLAGKYAGAFVSTGSPGGGQEATFYSIMSTFIHHGLIFVPLGYKGTQALIGNMDEVHGGSPWGAGTYAGTGARQPSELELDIARAQGKLFWEYVSRTAFKAE